MLTCFRTRRRIGAWLDGVLNEELARATAAHAVRCAGCRREADVLRRLRSLVRATPQPRDPDWTGFWPSVVRGIEDRRHTAPVRARRVWRPRMALGGALAAGLLLTLTLWQTATGPFRVADGTVLVSSADTDHPGGTVMVYSTPEKDLAVVWVFSEE